jgi:NitT/TauT family transport system substrate-binding protein
MNAARGAGRAEASSLQLTSGRRRVIAAGLTTPFIRRAWAVEPVRFGSVGGLTDAGLYLAEDQGFFTAAGIGVRMQRMPNAPALLTALATGQLDVAGISVTPGLFSAITRDVQVRVVADKQSVRPGFSATRLVVRKEFPAGTEAEQVAALKGKPLAISSRAASVAMVVRNYLAGFGMSMSDVRIVEMAYPSMVPALGSGAVDAAVVLEPFLSEALHMGIARMLNDLAAASGGTEAESSTSVPLVYSEAFARDHERAQGFMDAYLRGVRLYNDAFAHGIGRERIIGILAARANLDPAVVRDGFPAGLDPNGKVSLRFLSECQDYFIQQKYLTAPIDLTKLVDPSFAADTVKRLGEYKAG